MSTPSTSGLSVELLLRVIDIKYGYFTLLFSQQNKRCIEQKQKLCTPCTCVLHFCTFLCRYRPGNDLNWPNLKLGGERDHLTINFQLSV